MAFFTFSGTVGIGASLNPLQQSGAPWKYDRAPYDATVEILCNSTLASLLLTLTAGSDEIMQEAPISIGGTAGVLPGRLNIEPITFQVKAGDLIQPRFRNTNAAANTLNFSIEMTRR